MNPREQGTLGRIVEKGTPMPASPLHGTMTDRFLPHPLGRTNQKAST